MKINSITCIYNRGKTYSSYLFQL